RFSRDWSSDVCSSDLTYFPEHFPCNNGWQGEGVRTLDDAKRLAHEGLPIDGVKALEVASEKVSQIYREYDVPSFSSCYDVTGSDVDVARYLSGEPENMIRSEERRVGKECR